MATTTMTSANALTVQLWASADWATFGQHTAFGHLFERGAVHYCKEFEGQRARGDTITYDFANKLTGIPTDGTLTGNEEALDLGSFSMSMGTTRIGVKNPNSDTIEQQRTLVDFPVLTRKLLPKRHMELLDTAVFYQLAGADPTSFTLNGTTWSGTDKKFVQGHNTPVAPSASRIVRPGVATTDEGLTSADKMTLQLIDYALEANATSDQPLEPFSDQTFDLFLSPEQVVDLKHDTTGAIQWFNIQLAKITGGMKNELEETVFKGMAALGQYAGVNIYQAPRVAYGVNSSTSAVITTVRRAVLVGQNALSYASPFGRPTEKSAMRYFDELGDYTYFKGMEARMIYGLKKTVASNSDDIGVIVMPTYAAAHS